MHYIQIENHLINLSQVAYIKEGRDDVEVIFSATFGNGVPLTLRLSNENGQKLIRYLHGTGTHKL